MSLKIFVESTCGSTFSETMESFIAVLSMASASLVCLLPQAVNDATRQTANAVIIECLMRLVI